MTRRGSLIYYLAAWALGCFFMIAVVWCRAMIGVPSREFLREGTEGFLLLMMYGYLFGAPVALLYGLVLRRIMAGLKCKTPLHWAIVGAFLAPVLVVALGVAGRSAAQFLSPDHAGLLFPLVGAEAMLHVGWWLTIPAGAATAYYLGRIQRAFSAPSDAAAPAANASA
jgi:hypothetical protein